MSESAFTSDLRKIAKDIFNHALAAVEPRAAVRSFLQLEGSVLRCGSRILDISDYDKIIVTGAGKAGAPMAAAIEEIFGSRIFQGIVAVKDGHILPLERIELIEAAHPVPDRRGVEAARRIQRLVSEHASAQTLVINLVSGGASALLPSPAEGISLEDKQLVTRLLLQCGADISEINCVRKHLSLLKGGGLARLAAPSTIISLLISDVIGDDPAVIGSGPAYPDSTTWEDALSILKKYRLADKAPAAVIKRIEAGVNGLIKDTPKDNDPVFHHVTSCIIASNRIAISAAAERARTLGFAPLVLSAAIHGETAEAAIFHASIAREINESGNPLPRPCCIISGGETTVTIEGEHGLGGRNQEFALAAAREISRIPDCLIMSAGTDGTDGPTDAAGASVTGSTVDNALKIGLDPKKYLDHHDSYSFFKKTGELIITGPTMTNVMDIHLVLAK